VPSASPAAAPANPDSPARPQGRPVDDASSVERDSRVPESPPGRLRIAVEQTVPTDAARFFAEALAAHRAGNLAVARPLYERVLTLAPNDADALNNLGVLLSTEREFDRALELLRRAAAVAPTNAGTWNNIGAALREQGHAAEAATAFRRALMLDPQHQGAKVGLAQQYLATGAPAQARALLDEVLAANPALAEAHYTLGQALELLGDRAGAIRSYAAFMRLAPARLAEHVERVRRHVDSLSALP
jgi:Tfp pilus assembly protein PilF